MKYYKAENVIRKRAEDLADTSYWEYGNPKNVDEWIEVAEMEFKDLPTIETSEDCISRVTALDIAVAYVGAEMVDRMLAAPSVVPKVNKDEWVEEFSDDGWRWVKDEL